MRVLPTMREGHVFKDLREKVDAFRIKFLAENDTISIRKDQSSISFRFSSATSDTPRAAIIVSLTGSSTDPYHDFPSYVLNHRHFVSPKGFATHHSNDCIDVFDQDSSSDPEMSFLTEQIRNVNSFQILIQALSIDSSESDLEVAALGIASSVMGVNVDSLRSDELVQRRSARIQSIVSVLESAQSGFIEWNPTNPIIFKVELQRSLLSAYAISSAIGKIGESLQQRLFTKLSSIIVNPSFRLYLDRKIRPFLNECFSVFHFILPSVSNCVEDVLPSISTDILSSGVESFIRPSRNQVHTVDVQNFPVVSSITCVSHCFALRFGNFSLTTDDKIHLSEIDDYDYYPNRESISLNHLGVAVMPISDTSRFDLFIPSVISTKFIPVEVRTRKDLDYPALIDKYFSLGNDSVFVFKNGNFPFAIIFHFHERDFQPPPIDQQRPSTTMRSMLQCNVESMLTVPEELAYPAKVDSGTRSVPISSDIDLDHVDSSPTSSVEEPDTLPTSRAQNKCGICRKPGHTRRNCSLKEKRAKRPRR
ncbi:hypothetical protein GEMRC1_013567 [Eukaryota sp. GEM-RC1]